MLVVLVVVESAVLEFFSRAAMRNGERVRSARWAERVVCSDGEELGPILSVIIGDLR